MIFATAYLLHSQLREPRLDHLGIGPNELEKSNYLLSLIEENEGNRYEKHFKAIPSSTDWQRAPLLRDEVMSVSLVLPFFQ
jgi:hypothetical protein